MLQQTETEKTIHFDLIFIISIGGRASWGRHGYANG